MRTSASAVCMWSIEPHIYITISVFQLSVVQQDQLMWLRFDHLPCRSSHIQFSYPIPGIV